MVRVKRIKDTNQIVYPLEASKGGHTLCLVPFDKVTKKGNRGQVVTIKDSKLVEDDRFVVFDSLSQSG